MNVYVCVCACMYMYVCVMSITPVIKPENKCILLRYTCDILQCIVPSNDVSSRYLLSLQVTCIRNDFRLSTIVS